MHVKIRISLPGGQCLVCGKSVGFLRRRTGISLCCDEHEKQILADLRELALSRQEAPVEEPSREESTAV
jgi:hypothetical protein